MSTKNSLILIVAIAFLALTGLGAAKLARVRAPIVRDDVVSQSSQAEAFQWLETQAKHSEALAQSGPARQEQRWDRIARHSEALAQTEQSDQIRAEQLWDLIVAHAEALAR